MSLFDSLPDIPQGLKDAGNSISTGVTDTLDSIKSKYGNFADKFDPSSARLDAAKLLKGGLPRSSESSAAKAKFSGDVMDWRVRLSLAGGADYFYKGSDPGILFPLVDTGGVIFPYTPNISMTHSAKYGSQSLTHSNYTNYNYEGSEVAAISITGEFTAQNSTEAAYVLACIHFFRSCTKMWWGDDPKAGTPPPMLFLTGYGENYFPNVPCVITSFQHTMPQDVDYVQAITKVGTSTSSPVPVTANQAMAAGGGPGSIPGGSTQTTTKSTMTMIPTMSQLQITLQPIYSRKNIYKNFSLDAFAKGDLLGGADGGGFI
jgi:hypothetical protein